MKFIIEKNVLLENLTNVMRAISSRNIIPILNGVKFELDKSGLAITASDSDLIIQSFIPEKSIKKIEKTGTTIIQSKYLLDIIRKLPTGDINLEVIDGFKIIISTTNTVFNLNCLNDADYPKIKFEELENPLIIESSKFKRLIGQTLFAISNQESRPILTGLNLKIEEEKLYCIATDSYRLAKKTINLDKKFDDIDIVIPGKNLYELDKILLEKENVEIHPFVNKIIFKYDNYIFQSNLLSGSYPNTSNLMPTEFDIVIETSLNEYKSAIDRAALLTQNKDKNIVKMETREKEALISSFASEIGKVEETVLINNSTSNNIAISFSSKYMLEALKTFEEEELLIYLNTDSKPIILKTKTDESLIQLILPIKTY